MSIRMREKLNKSITAPQENQEVYIPPSEEELDDFKDELTQEQKDLIDLQEYLSSVSPKDAPMVSELEAWKSKHRTLFVSKISADSEQPYVFTTLKRKDFKVYQEKGVFDNEEKGYEVLVEKCLLYPTPTQAWRLISDAGVITTLGKQIAYKSGFVSQQEALSLIKIV